MQTSQQCKYAAVVQPGISSQPLLLQTHLKPQPPRTWSRTSSVETAASAAAATGWPSRDTASSGHEPEPQRPHPLVTAVAAVLLAVRDASSRAAAGTRGAGRRLARLQVWLGKPEALLFREGCQLLACLMFILLYVWRYASVLPYLQLVLSGLEVLHGITGTTQAAGTEALTESHSTPISNQVAASNPLPCPAQLFMSCSTYSPVVHGSGRWWLDLVLSLLFAADYVHRTLVGAAACCAMRS